MYNIFLDDERFPPSQKPRNYTSPVVSPMLLIVRCYLDFVWLIDNYGLPKFISFDHDLGEDKTGLDCANYLVQYCLDNDLKPIFKWFIHSQNPIGKANIDGLLKNFLEVQKTG